MGAFRTWSCVGCLLLSAGCHLCRHPVKFVSTAPRGRNLRLLKPLYPRSHTFTAEGTIEVMAMSFNTFSPPQMRIHSQFIPYNGPPKPKQSCQISSPKNVPFSEEFPDIDDILRNKSGLNTQPMNGGDSTPVPYGVEIVDLTCSGRHPLAKWKILHPRLAFYDD